MGWRRERQSLQVNLKVTDLFNGMGGVGTSRSAGQLDLFPVDEGGGWGGGPGLPHSHTDLF